MNEVTIRRFLHSRAFVMVAVAVSAMLATAVAMLTADVNTKSALQPAMSPLWQRVVSMMAVIVVAQSLFLLNKKYVFIRENTMLYISLFVFTTMVNPCVATAFNLGLPLTLILLAATYVLFSLFRQSHNRGGVFLVMAMLSATSLWQPSVLLYVPVFLLGVMQMGLYGMRSILAAAIGVAAPLWVAYALSGNVLTVFHLPDFSSMAEQWVAGFSVARLLHTVFIVALGTTFGIINAWTIMSYSNRRRSYNGFLNLLAVATLLIMAVDFANTDKYIILVNALTAIQAAHFFTIRKFAKDYVVIIALIAVDVALSVATVINIL